MRRGTVLVVVSGLVSVIAALTTAFLVEMRADNDESYGLVRTAQARAMLVAGLQYVAETSRLGWDTFDFSRPGSSSNRHREAFGWIDVRDGQPGPRDQDGVRLFSGDASGRGTTWPAIGGVARCPTYAMRIPPWAVRLDVAPNPIPADPTLPWADLVSFKVHDPRPALGASFAAFAAGDTRPVARSLGRSWFRVRRDDVARFTLTCGAGATAGYRTWQEVLDDGADAQFGDEAAFAELRAQETILWFETEWNPAVSGGDQGFYDGPGAGTIELNRLGSPQTNGWDRPNPRNFAGSFTWIRRLFVEPADW